MIDPAPSFGRCCRLLYLAALCLCVAPGQQPDIKVDVTLVRVPFVAEDAAGQPFRDLRPEELNLTEDGARQNIEYLWTEMDLPLTVALVIDISSSQMGLVRSHEKSAERFITRVIGPSDRALLATVDEQPRLLVDLTSSAGELLRAAELVRQQHHAGTLFGEPCLPWRRYSGPGKAPCIGTAIWDGVFHIVRTQLLPVEGRKALVLLSDGLDLNASVHTLSSAIEAAQSAGTTIYTIRYLSAAYLVISPALAARALHDHGMEQIALETGGLAFKNPKDLDRVYDRIEQDLRSQYVLAYRPQRASVSGSWHATGISTTRTGARIRAHAGYRVP